MITRHIADLLYHNECVMVPGLGGFIKASIPARILHTTHEFYPPTGNVAFNAGLSANDGILANYIATIENKTYTEALSEIRQWCEECNETLKHGETITLDGIGDLFLNASGRIEFKPSKAINFNADSFGLPVFFAKTVNFEPLPAPEKQPVKYIKKSIRLRRLLPETLKWAAVLAPFIGFALWSSLNGNIIDNYVHNYTGMFSWVRSTPGKTAPVKVVSPPVKDLIAPSEQQQSPALVLAEANISFNPNIVSYTELAKHNITIGATVEEVSKNGVLTGQKYQIIGGAFRDPNNALKLIVSLKEQGYPAYIADTTPGGLYVVSMKGCDDLTDAKSQLSEIKKAGFSSSWILKKRNL